MISKLLQKEVQQYIKDHQNDDPFLLSLHAKKGDGFPWKEAIEQIHALQKAKSKLPSWVAASGIVWPVPLSVEQSSSELTASFKAKQIPGKSMADLTGGMGVDTSFFACNIREVHYVEVNKELACLAAHNFEVLGKSNIIVHNNTAEAFLASSTQHFDFIYLDPSRRNQYRKVFLIEDCTPNLYDIIPKCHELTSRVLVKLSPMVDLSMLIRDFAPSQIWVVSIKNEVKEVLCLIEKEKTRTIITAVDLLKDGDDTLFRFDQEEEALAQNEFSLPLTYVYEPSAGILKTGAFKLIGQRFNLKKLHISTHLYTSEVLVSDFPGRVFSVMRQIHMDKKEIAKSFPDKKVNVLTRNYPLSPEQLKMKLGLKDGGITYLIGTTLMAGQKVLLWCKRM